MRLALAQINSVVGDLDGNARTGRRMARAGARGERRPRPLPRARRHRLSAGGPAAPPRRSSARPGVRSRRSRRRHAASRRSSARRTSTPTSTTRASCSPMARSQCVYRKRYLPNYGVFDEDRYFAPGDDLFLLRFGDVVVGPTICEDIWQPGPPATDLALAGAQLVANISASPFHVGKDREREEMLKVRALDNSCFVALCNAVGGQDELIFDGHSVVLDDEGEVLARAAGLRGGAARGRRRSRRRGRPPAARRPAPGTRTRPAARRADERRARAAARADGAGSSRGSCRRSTTSSRCGSRSSSACAIT